MGTVQLPILAPVFQVFNCVTMQDGQEPIVRFPYVPIIATTLGQLHSPFHFK